MGLFDEFREGAERFRVEIDALKTLLSKHEVKGPGQLVDLYRRNPDFKSEWNAIWSRLGKDHRGKVSLATAGAILGAALGGVGVAALGGAIGIPLLAVLGVGGLLAGTEFDSASRKSEFVKVELPVGLEARLRERAKTLGEEPRALLWKVLDAALGDSGDDGANS